MLRLRTERLSAGRDTGDLAFERRHPVEHLRYVATALPGRVELRLTAWQPRYTWDVGP